jgi:hypothetical protein
VAWVVTKTIQLVVTRDAESDNVVENVHMTTVPLIAENQEDLLDASISLFHNHPVAIVMHEMLRVDV